MWNQFIICVESQMLLQKQCAHVLQMCHFKDSINRKTKGCTDFFFQMQLDIFFKCLIYFSLQKETLSK